MVHFALWVLFGDMLRIQKWLWENNFGSNLTKYENNKKKIQKKRQMRDEGGQQKDDEENQNFLVFVSS